MGNEVIYRCPSDLSRQQPFTDIDLTVTFKAVAGKLDQGGGPVWRYRDANTRDCGVMWLNSNPQRTMRSSPS